MREIKFRYAWKRREDNHIWIEIVQIDCLEHRGDTPFIHSDYSEWEVIARDLFTGLKDKNGVEIYEGDIVKDYSVRENAVVGFGGGRFNYTFKKKRGQVGDDCFDVSTEYCSLYHEVIGNIYENADLLK